MTDRPPYLQALELAPGLTVADVEVSMAFYAALGFDVEMRWEQEGKLLGAMLVAGNGKLGLSQDDWQKGKDRQKGIGMRVWINTAQDVDEIASRAKANGIALDSEPEDYEWGGRGFGVTDPDGFKLTISRENPKD